MTSILVDLRTGDPIMGEDGDFIKVDNNYAFYELITQLLYCQVGSEIWNLYYGFDLENAIKMNSRGEPEQVIESLVVDALDPQKERLIFTIDYVKATRIGQQVTVKFMLKSRFGSLITSEFNLGETINAI